MGRLVVADRTSVFHLDVGVTDGGAVAEQTVIVDPEAPLSASEGFTLGESANVVTPSGGEDSAPVFDSGAHTLQLTESFDTWTGYNRTAVANPKLRVMGDSASGSGGPVAFMGDENAVLGNFLVGRGGTGKAVRIYYPNQLNDGSQGRHYIGTAGVTCALGKAWYLDFYWRLTGGAAQGYGAKQIQFWHSTVEAASRVQLSAFFFGAPYSDDAWHVNSLANSLAKMNVSGAMWNDLNDGVNWQQIVVKVKANTTDGARDGMCRQWINDVLTCDLSQRGVDTGRCTGAELDNLVYGVNFTEIRLGELFFRDDVAQWWQDYDDVTIYRDT